jgi:hypothetical protein
MNLSKLRNKVLDSTINVLTKAKAKPDRHQVALDAILNDPDTTDDEKLDNMRKYFNASLQEVVDNA